MIGRTLAGRYELGDVLGEGGMATVFRAHDRTLERDVAVKVLREQYAADPEFVERFEREARAAARLAHPNVVDVFDVGEEGSTRYIVMELVDGDDLKSLVRRGGALPPALVVRFGREIAAALEYAHRRGLVHRDVKPQNVLVDPDGHAKLTDFGIAQAVDNVSLTQTGTVMGTAQYMSPEQARGRGAGPASDIYSLGVVLYELATGQLPFDGDTPLAIALRHVQEEPVQPRQLNPSIPPTLEAIILRALAKEPAERFASAAELAEELDEVTNPVGERTAKAPPVIDEGRLRPQQLGQTDDRRRAAAARTEAVSVAPPTRPNGRPRSAGGDSRSIAGRPVPVTRPAPRRGSGLGALLLALLALVTVGALALGFTWLFSGGGRTDRPAGQPTAVPSPSSVPAVAVTPSATAAGQAAPTATRGATATPVPSPSPNPPTATPDPPTQPPTPTAAASTATARPSTATPVPPPQPPTATREGRVTVPNVRGLPLRQAEQQLSARGLVVEIRDANEPRQPDGVVVDQDPNEGATVAPRSTVRLKINRLGTVSVPNIAGMQEDEARKTLEKEGLKTRVERDSGGRKGVVYDQSPEPGVKVAPGTEVRIIIGS